MRRNCFVAIAVSAGIIMGANASAQAPRPGATSVVDGWGQAGIPLGLTIAGLPVSAANNTNPAGDAKTPVKEALPTSIFFTAEELERMRLALINYEKSKSEKATTAEAKANDFLNQITDAAPKIEAPPEETSYTYPQFFLNSIVFHALNDWYVIINGQKFTSTNMETPDLILIGVDQDQVTMQWRPKKMEHVRESWAKYKNDDIIVDTAAVTFTLHSNQTFSSYVMRVVEGRLKPVTITFNKDGTVPATTPAVAAPTAAADAPKDSSTDTNKKIEYTSTDDIKNDTGAKAMEKTYQRLGLEK